MVYSCESNICNNLNNISLVLIYCGGFLSSKPFKIYGSKVKSKYMFVVLNYANFLATLIQISRIILVYYCKCCNLIC